MFYVFTSHAATNTCASHTGMQVAVIKARPTKPTETESQQKLFARDEAVYETECV